MSEIKYLVDLWTSVPRTEVIEENQIVSLTDSEITYKKKITLVNKEHVAVDKTELIITMPLGRLSRLVDTSIEASDIVRSHVEGAGETMVTPGEKQCLL
jgi:hypothetical protein